MRRIETADLVRVEGDRVYALNDQDELSIFDIRDIDWPKRLGAVHVDGESVALFVRGAVAIVALTELDPAPPSDRGSRLVVVDLRDPAHPATLAEARIAGSIRDVHAVDDAFYVVGEDGPPGASSVVVTSFTFTGAGLRRAGELRRPGRDPSFVVGATKLAVAFNARRDGVEGAKVVVADTGTDPSGAFVEAGEVSLRGAIAPRAEPALDDEEKYLQVLGCASRECAPGAVLLLSAVDVGDPYAPREVSEQGLPSLEGPPVAAFAGDRLYFAGDRGFDARAVTTLVRVVDLADPTRPAVGAPLVVPGSVGAFVPAGDRVITVGYRMRTPDRMHVQLNEIDADVPARPRLIGSLEFGEELTSSLAASEPRAAAVHEGGRRVALPFRTWSPIRRSPASGVAVLQTDATALVLRAASPVDGWVERVLFLRDRVVAVTDSSLTVMSYEEVERPDLFRPWRAPEDRGPGE